jgi:hypothetical protein
MPPTTDSQPQQVVVLDNGVLAVGSDAPSFTADRASWVDVASIPGSDGAASITATGAGDSRVLVALTSSRTPRFLLGEVDPANVGNPVVWSDGGVRPPKRTSISGFAVGPTGGVVIGFDRATLRPVSWTGGPGGVWQPSDPDEKLFSGGAPGLVAVGKDVIVALGMESKEPGVARARPWTSVDGRHWNRVDTDGLGAFPPPPSHPCPTSAPREARSLLDMAGSYPASFGALWPRCFSNRELSIRGYVRVCDGCGGASTDVGRPAWLLDSLGYAAFWLAADRSQEGSPGNAIAVQIDPKHPVRVPRARAHVRITGHFDDAASSTCRMVPDISVISQLAPPAVAIETCRREFVVTSIKVLAG